ncbi:MAG: flippase [Bacteroidales bacterium]|nr:flippase [Bacteroidales bacterium]
MAKRSFFDDILSVMSSNIFALILGLLTGIVISRVLGPEGRGLYTSVYVVPIIVISFVTFGIRRSAIFHIGRKLFDEEDIVSTIYSLLLITSSIGIIVSGIVYYFINNSDFTYPIIILSLLTIPVRLAVGYSRGIFLGKERFRYANQLKWMPVFLNLIFVAAFVWWAGFSVMGVILSIFVAYFIVAIYALVMINRSIHIRLAFIKLIAKSMLKLGAVYAIALLVMQLNYRIDILVLQRLSSFSEVGYYSLGVSIAERLWQIPFAMGIVIMSRSANVENEDELNSDVARMLRISFLIAIIAAIVLYIITPYLIPLLYGKRFIPSAEIVQMILPGILMFIIFRILNSRVAGMGKPQFAIYVFLPALVVNVFLNYIWIPKYGGIGAAMATNVSYILGTITFLIIFSRLTKMSIIEIVGYKKEDFNFVASLKNKIFAKWGK